MIDKQRLIYDLSLQCAALQVQRELKLSDYLPAEMLEVFTSYVLAYNAMDEGKLSAALEELKKVRP